MLNWWGLSSFASGFHRMLVIEFTASVLQIFDCICVINLWVHLTVALPCVMGCLGSLQLGLPCSPLLSLGTLKTTEQMEARWCSQLPFKFKIAQIFSWNNLRNKILEDMCAWFIKKKPWKVRMLKQQWPRFYFQLQPCLVYCKTFNLSGPHL